MTERKSYKWTVVDYLWNDQGMHQVEFEAKVSDITIRKLPSDQFHFHSHGRIPPFPVSREEAEEAALTGEISRHPDLIIETGEEIDYEVLEHMPTRRWRGWPTIVLGRPSDAKAEKEMEEEAK
tara:strand:- start:56 stop:424 length:369 start_codon:yes stop_codon:yes gene_type:complete